MNRSSLKKNLKSLSKVRSGRDLVKHVVNVQKDNYNFAKKLIFNRQGYSPSSIQVLDRHGNENIIGIRVYRMPLSQPLMTLFDAVTLKKFSKRLSNEDYDKLFHLRLDIQTDKGNTISFEKTAHIQITVGQPTEKGSESVVVQMVPDITVFELIDNTRKYMGESRFWIYRAKSENCQNLVLSCAEANGFITPELRTFIKQDTNALFDNYLRKLANTATDMNGRLEVLYQGGNMNDSNDNFCVNCNCENCNYKKQIMEGEGILKGLRKLGKKLGKPFEKSVGVNPFTLGYKLGHDVIAPGLKKAIKN